MFEKLLKDQMPEKITAWFFENPWAIWAILPFLIIAFPFMFIIRAAITKFQDPNPNSSEEQKE